MGVAAAMQTDIAVASITIEYLLCRRQSKVKEFARERVTVGAREKCDISFPDEGIVADRHCTLKFEANRWVLYPEAGQRVWVNDTPVTEPAALSPGAIVFLGKLMGPGFRVLQCETMQPQDISFSAALKEIRAYRTSLMASAARAASEKPYQRRVVRRWLTRLHKKHRRRLFLVAGLLAAVILFSAGLFLYQQHQLNALHALAEDIFYQMKSIELQISRTEELVAVTGDSTVLEQNDKLWAEFKKLEAQYDAYLRELGFGDEVMPEDERLILRIARVFGECELNAPEEFIRQVKVYINKWKTTPRYREAITRALESGYVGYIAETLMRQHLPPHFLYLAMQESDFDRQRCGPRTRYGIAKGMWQFIPTTAVYYGLKLGPLVEVRRPDPQDERHHFKKSTRAAAKYLKFLYTTEAQASGLLVMASYNWGETKVRRLINKLPENPRARNFWALMKKYKLPRETRDYVFYILSAAVIGENPQLFGFDLESPLAGALD